MTLYTVLMTIHILGYILTFCDLVYASMQKPSKMQMNIVLMCVSILFWISGYFYELKASVVDVALTGTLVSYMGKPFIMMFFFFAVCDFYEFPLKKSQKILMYLLAVAEFLMVLTNPLHRLFYRSWSFDASNVYSPLALEIGPLVLFHYFMLIFYFVLCIVFIIKGYRKTKDKAAAPYAVYFELMVLSGLTGFVIYLTGITRGYDTSMFGCIAGVFWMSILFYRFDLLDAVEVAKEAALEKAPTGIVVLDHLGTLAYSNGEGKRFLNGDGKTFSFADMGEKVRYLTVGDLIYKIKQEKIYSEEKHICTSYEISDVTDSMNYQKKLETEVTDRTERIRQIQRQIVGSMANVVEARSLETGEHIKRTSESVEEIAREYARLQVQGNEAAESELLSQKDIDLLVSAAPLHDVGKISVPDAILLKPGKLTPEEFEVMKTHTTKGAEVIENVMRGVESDEYVDLAKEIALYHHERWDGTGYPTGLAGEQIPLAARIMAVADVYDALTAERCYKKAFSKEKALQIIKEESGTHFDPEVVRAFFSCSAIQ